jgi:ASC-1-like (ASCH) protein
MCGIISLSHSDYAISKKIDGIKCENFDEYLKLSYGTPSIIIKQSGKKFISVISQRQLILTEVKDFRKYSYFELAQFTRLENINNIIFNHTTFNDINFIIWRANKDFSSGKFNNFGIIDYNNFGMKYRCSI